MKMELTADLIVRSLRIDFSSAWDKAQAMVDCELHVANYHTSNPPNFLASFPLDYDLRKLILQSIESSSVRCLEQRVKDRARHQADIEGD